MAAALLAVALALAAGQQDGAADEDIILFAWANPATCNADVARPVALEELLAGRPDLAGVCVAVEGYWASRALFMTARDANRAGAQTRAGLRGRRLGVYARAELLDAAPRRGARYRLIGSVGRCETEWPDAMMVMGYCHYTGGPIIRVAQAVPLPMQ